MVKTRNMRVHRCVGDSQQSQWLFKTNSNHFSIKTIVSRNRGQVQTGHGPAGDGRGWVGGRVNRRHLRGNKKHADKSIQTHKCINVPDTPQPCLQMKDTHTGVHCSAAKEPGKAACSLITALTSEPADILTPEEVRPTGAIVWPHSSTSALRHTLTHT